MIKTITQDDLIRYVYLETSVEENKLIENTIIWDEEMNRDLSDFKFMKKEMSKIELKPSNKMSDNLIFFSKNYSA